MRSILLYFLPSLAFFIFSSTLSLPNGPDSWSNLHRRPLPPYANLSSPVAGQVLYRGRPFRVAFANSAMIATATQVALVNSTGVYILRKDLTLSRGRVNTRIILPKWVGDGTYDFVFSESDGQPRGHGPYVDVIPFSIHVGHRPQKVKLSSLNLQEPEASNQNTRLSTVDKREPHLPRFNYPLQNQSISPGQSVRISFIDGELDTEEAQFVLRKTGTSASPEDIILTGPSSSNGSFAFNGSTLVTDVIFPRSVPSGSYTLVAQELYPDARDDILEVASIDVKIGTNIPAEGNIPNGETQAVFPPSRLVNIDRRDHVEKREPHLSYFGTPAANRTIVAGHHLNILFVDGEVTVQQARFVLRNKDTGHKETDLILYGKNSTSEGYFSFQGYSVKARVLCPQLVPNGSYYLVAQELDPQRTKVLDVTQVEVQVSHEEIGSEVLIEKSAKPPAFGLPNFPKSLIFRSKQFVRPPAFLDETTEIRHLEPRPNAVSRSPAYSTTKPKVVSRRVRQSPSIIEPRSGQNVPIGSKFECKIHDLHATTETVHFLLRSVNGQEYELGKARFQKGIAAMTVTCPRNLKFDSYSVIARENSIKRPKVFLDVVSTSIIVSHPQEAKRASHVPDLVKPDYNQVIPPGDTFECELLNGGASSENIRFCIRFEDGSSDMTVGAAAMNNSVVSTTCQIPSNVIPGTYMFVAQESSQSNPQVFKDVQSTIVTLAIPKHSGQNQRRSVKIQESKKVSFKPFSSNKATSRQQKHQTSTLLAPIPNQELIVGQSFDVKVQDSNSTGSTLLKFILKPEISSRATKVHELGMSSNSDEVEERLMCPHQIQNGVYLFVVQGNNASDPDVFNDSASTTVIVTDQENTFSGIDSTSVATTTATPLNWPTPTAASIPTPSQNLIIPSLPITTVSSLGPMQSSIQNPKSSPLASKNIFTDPKSITSDTIMIALNPLSSLLQYTSVIFIINLIVLDIL